MTSRGTTFEIQQNKPRGTLPRSFVPAPSLLLFSLFFPSPPPPPFVLLRLPPTALRFFSPTTFPNRSTPSLASLRLLLPAVLFPSSVSSSSFSFLVHCPPFSFSEPSPGLPRSVLRGAAPLLRPVFFFLQLTSLLIVAACSLFVAASSLFAATISLIADRLLLVRRCSLPDRLSLLLVLVLDRRPRAQCSSPRELLVSPQRATTPRRQADSCDDCAPT